MLDNSHIPFQSIEEHVSYDLFKNYYRPHKKYSLICFIKKHARNLHGQWLACGKKNIKIALQNDMPFPSPKKKQLLNLDLFL